MIPAFTALGSGEVVLMLHGIGGGHLAFAPQVETLAGSGYRAVAWDMPGYGHSAPIEPYTFKGLAEACIRLIEALLANEDIERRRTSPTRAGVVLVGHSMGGMVAQEVVARRPELVRRLVLCGTSPAFGRRPDGSVSDTFQREFVNQRTAPLDAGQTMADLAQKLVPQMIGPGALPEGVALAIHCMSQIPPGTYRRALEALVTFDRSADLARIRVPTLVLAGEFDRTAPPSVMKRMADAIPGSIYLELKGVGHLQPLEAPEDFDGALLNFLNLPDELT